MRKRVFAAILFSAAIIMPLLQCGKSYCKQYEEKYCQTQNAQGAATGTAPTDAKSAACAAAREKVKTWSSAQCRVEFNNAMIEEQSKQMDKILE